MTPDPSNFYLPLDQHYAQLNICIIACGGPGTPMDRQRAAKSCEFDVQTANADQEREQEVIVRAEADLQPSKQVLDIVLPLVRQVPGFQRIARTPPEAFSLHLPDFPQAKVTDQTRGGCLTSLLGLIGVRFRPRYDVQIRLSGGQATQFTFVPNFNRSAFGDAHIFHLTQIGADRRVQGGLTLVFVVV